MSKIPIILHIILSYVFRFQLRIRLVSTDLRIEKEAYVYPAISFIGELGGSLGLFVGFSFLTIFDFFDFIENIFKCMKNHFQNHI